MTTGFVSIPGHNTDAPGNGLKERVTADSRHVITGAVGTQVTPKNAAAAAYQPIVQLGVTPTGLSYFKFVINAASDTAAATMLKDGYHNVYYLNVYDDAMVHTAGEIITSVSVIAVGLLAGAANTGVVDTADTQATILSNLVKFTFASSEEVRAVNVGLLFNANGVPNAESHIYCTGYKHD